ncbi:putative RING-H2 finger protein ATL53 [Ziziphus jujuba]|uniref:RING-type E3 ubiquitin transferase n=1 Tax=Ziziphus jujuba TaxID=326968 RepID=A0A6P3Z086_ZIZJJ|nr:putative RING-H2 finger protein ATL53 [Ziziphus jujuba]
MPMNPVTSQELKPSHWNPWVITSVATICIVIMLFAYLRIIKTFCNNISRNQDGRRLLNVSNPDDPSLQFHSHGLDFSFVHSLPITQFKKDNQGKSEMAQSNMDCAVCLGEFEEGEWLRHLTNCKHVFHISCIDTWCLTNSNCPICRSEVYGLGLDHEYSASMYTLLETLTREDFFRERAEHYQFLRSTILQNSVSSIDPRHAN